MKYDNFTVPHAFKHALAMEFMVQPAKNKIRPMPDNRKLAAVMFADIEGYTALFQHHETAAIKQVEDHRMDLGGIVKRYHGKIIQFYGDGSVTVFDSIIDALHCAIGLQKLSSLHRIPVRIGIHLGDLVYKNGDIFGDAVNIASRIQALGIPGSILVSKKVTDELTGHPEFQTIPLGVFSLKNVNKKLEIFAVKGDGLVIPAIRRGEPVSPARRKFMVWSGIIVLIAFATILARDLLFLPVKQLGEERVILPPFTDFSSNPEFASLGDIASSYMTNALNRQVTANIISYESMLRYANIDLASISQFPAKARRMGAEVIIHGNYTLTGSQKDSLLFWMSIVDLRSQDQVPVSLADVRCHSSDPMECLDALVDNLKGYWKSKGDNLFRKTNGKAYAAYNQAQKIWADPDMKQQAKAFLREAIRLDPKFLNAYFLLADAFNNDGEYEQEADTLALIRARFDDLSPREENFLHYYEADLQGKHQNAFQYFLREYAHDSSDLFLTTTGMVMAMEYLNDPQTTLRFFKRLNADSLDLNTCTYCHTTINMAMEAYAYLSDMEQVRGLAERLIPYAKRPAHFTQLMAYYISQGDTSTTNQIIRHGMAEGKHWDDESYYCLLAARLARVHGKIELSNQYAQRALLLYNGVTNRTTARCYSLLGDWQKARNIYLQEITKQPENKTLLGELGVIYAREGNYIKAKEMISLLDGKKTLYDFGQTSYLQGRINAHMHDVDGAIRMLHLALDEGIKFRIATTFQHDPDLMVLNTEPEYLRLLRSRRLNK